ncbi:hypothetical protein [Stutzerimonas stutzeri]|nr:hypothetical protein [Stutzerimonas stutzeri]
MTTDTIEVVTELLLRRAAIQSERSDHLIMESDAAAAARDEKNG